jgi:hypothetical protein
MAVPGILSGLAFQAIAFDVPTSGAKCVATGLMLFDASHLSWTLDPTQSNQLLEMQNIQSIYVDNTANQSDLTITVSGTGHRIKVPAFGQGFLPLICGDRPVITFTGGSISGSAQAWLLNTPALGCVWVTNTP